MFRPLHLRRGGGSLFRIIPNNNYFSLTCWGIELSRIFDPTNNTDDEQASITFKNRITIDERCARIHE